MIRTLYVVCLNAISDISREQMQTKGRSQTPCQLYSPKNAIATVEDAHTGLWQQKKRRKKPEVRPASFVFSDSIRASLNLPPPPLGHWAVGKLNKKRPKQR